MTEPNIMDGFDFLTEPVEKQGAKLVEESKKDRGPNLRTLAKFTPRKLAQDILDVLYKPAEEGGLGGAYWILQQAKIDPRGFMDLLKRILPRNLQLDGVEGLSITLIDTFGNQVKVDAAGSGAANATSGNSPASGQRQIATGGNPIDVQIADKAEDMK